MDKKAVTFSHFQGLFTFGTLSVEGFLGGLLLLSSFSSLVLWLSTQAWCTACRLCLNTGSCLTRLSQHHGCYFQCSPSTLSWQVFIFQLCLPFLPFPTNLLSSHFISLSLSYVYVSLSLCSTLLCSFCLLSYVFIRLCLHLSWLVSPYLAI
jgi:hypothetical protein